MIKNRLVLFSLIGLFLFSCKKTEQEADTTGNINKLVIPEGFKWENSRDVNFEIRITDTRFQNSVHVVSIYDGDPNQGGKMLSKGSASIIDPFSTLIYIGNTVKEVFVEKTAPDGSSTMQKVTLGADVKVTLSLSAVSPKNKTAEGDVNKISGLDDSPDCTTGCTRTVSASNTNVTVNTGDVVCVTGNNITVNFNGNGGTIRICGANVTVQNVNLNNNAKLIVTRTATVQFNNLAMNGNNSEFINYGTSTITGSFSTKNSFINEGTLSISSDLSLNEETEFVNNGIINVGSSMKIDHEANSVNNGSIVIGKDFELKGDYDVDKFINNCFLWAKNEYKTDGDMYNYGLIKVNTLSTIADKSILSLHNGGMFSSRDVKLDGEIIGVGTRSLVKVSGTSTLTASSKITNSIQYCDANGLELNNSTFSGGASLGCTQYIPITNCNTEGNGTAPPVDTDGDGVMDAQDEYPTDPTKAYNNYYPSAGLETGATIAFEDQWPKKGDYDMNDLVMSYRYKIVTNSQNKVVQVVGDFNLTAAGGDFKNGFGIEFPVPRASVSGLTGGTLETGQTNAVVIFFNDMHTQLANFNTRPGEPVSAPKSYTINFNIANGPFLNTFGLGSYNPFIWNSGIPNGRGYEVHLPGKRPTNLANTALFGTLDDKTNPSLSKYYVTSTGLPWAINIPIKPFKYPIEGAEISTGYLKFDAWATSGGTQFLDWYSNTAVGYRNNSKLF